MHSLGVPLKQNKKGEKIAKVVDGGKNGLRIQEDIPQVTQYHFIQMEERMHHYYVLKTLLEAEKV